MKKTYLLFLSALLLCGNLVVAEDKYEPRLLTVPGKKGSMWRTQLTPEEVAAMKSTPAENDGEGVIVTTWCGNHPKEEWEYRKTVSEMRENNASDEAIDKYRQTWQEKYLKE